jgi:outer membrane immunogenic protein
MRKILFGAAALLASTCLASAADLPARTYTKAPPMVSPAYNWSGFYIGVMGGYGWSSEATVGVTGIGAITGATDAIKGGFGGGTIGYNWQAPGSPFVWGVEVDAAAASISYSEAVLPIYSLDTKIQAMGSVTGRLGYAIDNALLYFKGGYAWADNKVSINSPFLGLTADDSQFHSGWTIGGGIEYGFAPNWSLKAEYMYVDLDTQSYFGVLDLGTSLHTIKGGINYRFGGL